MGYSNILFEVNGVVAFITINRPDKLNALNISTLTEIDSAIDKIIADKNIKAAIITGSGQKAFIAGADIRELNNLSPIQAYNLAVKGQSLFLKIEKSQKPILALVNGFALGGGCELAMACHFRIASENAKFGQPEVNLGLIPGYGGTQRLPRLVGRGVALELLLSGEMISAQRAYELGLVNKLVANENILEEGVKFLARILDKAPLAIKFCIDAVQQGLNTTLENGLEQEAKLFGLTFSTQDMKEGTDAFLEKRKANFKGK